MPLRSRFFSLNLTCLCTISCSFYFIADFRLSVPRGHLGLSLYGANDLPDGYLGNACSPLGFIPKYRYLSSSADYGYSAQYPPPSLSLQAVYRCCPSSLVIAILCGSKTAQVDVSEPALSRTHGHQVVHLPASSRILGRRRSR